MSLPSRAAPAPTQFQVACQELGRLARLAGPGAKLPTMVQLRQQLGVGVNTLSDALAELERQEVITRRQGSGIFVSERVRRTIALICAPRLMPSERHSPVWQLMLDRIQQRAEGEGEILELHLTRPQHHGPPFNEGLLRDLREGHINGVIGLGMDMAAVTYLEEMGVPCATYAGPGQHRVTTDADADLPTAVGYLRSQGVTRPGYWQVCGEGTPEHRQRSRAGFAAAATAAGLQCQEQLFRHAEAPSQGAPLTHQEQGFLVAQQFFSDPNRPAMDGLFIADDMMTLGALAAMDQLGIRPGQDFVLLTHANKGSTVLQGRSGLMLLEYDPGAIVDGLFETIECLMGGLEPPTDPVIVAPQLRPNN